MVLIGILSEPPAVAGGPLCLITAGKPARLLPQAVLTLAKHRRAGAIPTTEHAASVSALCFRNCPQVSHHRAAFVTKVSVRIQPPTARQDHRNDTLQQRDIQIV